MEFPGDELQISRSEVIEGWKSVARPQHSEVQGADYWVL